MVYDRVCHTVIGRSCKICKTLNTNSDIENLNLNNVVHNAAWLKVMLISLTKFDADIMTSWNGEFPAQRPVTRSYYVFSDLRLNNRLSKQSWGWWLETPSRPLWRHRSDITWIPKGYLWIQVNHNLLHSRVLFLWYTEMVRLLLTYGSLTEITSESTTLEYWQLEKVSLVLTYGSLQERTTPESITLEYWQL